MFKNKLYILSLIVGLALAAILVVAQFPTARPVPKDVPLALVNEDGTNASRQIENKLMQIDSAGKDDNAPTFKWTKLESKDALNKAMNEEYYYAAIVLPKDFSQKMASVMKSGNIAEIEIVINQAKDTMLANNMQSMLTGIVGKMSAAIGQQMLNQVKANNVPLQALNIDTITSPISTKVTVEHSVSEMNTASSAYFQPLWMASLFATFLIYTAGKATEIKKQRELWQLRLGQLGLIGVIAPIIGLVTTWLVTNVMNYTYDNFWTVAFFSMIGAAAFMLIMFALEMWLGFAALPVIALLMLFSAPLMQLAPEMIPNVYHDWLLPWLPIKFLLDGAKSIVYYGLSLFNQNTWNLIIVGIVGLTLALLSVGKDWFLINRQKN